MFHCKYFENSTTELRGNIASTEYLLAYLLIIVSFDDVTLYVIVLFIFGLTLPETLCVTCSVTMLLSLSQMCGHQTVRT